MIPDNSLDPCNSAFVELGIYGVLIVFVFVLLTVASDITRKYREDKASYPGKSKWLIVFALVALSTGLTYVSVSELISGGQNSVLNCAWRNII